MPTVLIIDDRSINRDYLRSLLTYLNYSTLEAQNGVEALQVAKENRPDLIISDVLMPEMDGYEMVRHFKKIESLQNIPIIFYTATYRKEEATLLAEDLGVQYVLSKPSDPQTMVETIQLALGDKSGVHPNIQKVAHSHTEAQTNIYQAPLKLGQQWSKLHQSLDQMSQMKDILHAANFAENDTTKMTLMSFADNLTSDLRSFRKIYSDLFSLIELTIEMISEKDAQKLLQLFCQGTRKPVNAEFAAAGILDTEGNIRYLATSGVNDHGFDSQKINLESEFFQSILRERSAGLITNSTAISWHNQQPSNILFTPLLTANQMYGFAYFISKKNNENFNEEDIRMLDTLASELAILYENIEQYHLIQQQATKLQIESSKLKAAKDELHKSEVMFRQFAENIEDVFWRTSSTMDKIIYISPGYETIWGKSTESIYQDPCSWQELIIEEDKSKVRSFIKQISTNEEGATLEYRIKHPSGMIRNIYNKTICLKDEAGKLDHIIGIATDVTEYLQNQKEIKLENELAELLEKDGSLVQIVPQILQLVCKIFEWEIGEMWLADDERNLLQNIGIWHKKRKTYAAFDLASANTTVAKHEDFPGVIWEHREPKRFGNYSSHPPFKRSSLMNQLELHDAAGLPLLYQDKVLGVMHFFSKKITHFDDNFHRILMMLGTRISEFIHQKMTQEQLLQLVRRGSYRVIF
jgi:PAS domain S-box-containing protein